MSTFWKAIDWCRYEAPGAVKAHPFTVMAIGACVTVSVLAVSGAFN